MDAQTFALSKGDPARKRLRGGNDQYGRNVGNIGRRGKRARHPDAKAPSVAVQDHAARAPRNHLDPGNESGKLGMNAVCGRRVHSLRATTRLNCGAQFGRRLARPRPSCEFGSRLASSHAEGGHCRDAHRSPACQEKAVRASASAASSFRQRAACLGRCGFPLLEFRHRMRVEPLPARRGPDDPLVRADKPAMPPRTP